MSKKFSIILNLIFIISLVTISCIKVNYGIFIHLISVIGIVNGFYLLYSFNKTNINNKKIFLSFIIINITSLLISYIIISLLYYFNINESKDFRIYYLLYLSLGMLAWNVISIYSNIKKPIINIGYNPNDYLILTISIILILLIIISMGITLLIFKMAINIFILPIELLLLFLIYLFINKNNKYIELASYSIPLLFITSLELLLTIISLINPNLIRDYILEMNTDIVMISYLTNIIYLSFKDMKKKKGEFN